MKWILIYAISTSVSPKAGTATHSVEFATRLECQSAYHTISNEFKRNDDFPVIHGACVQSSMEKDESHGK